MHFFLQGDKGIGKSTLLQEVLSPCAAVLAGFATQRLTAGGRPVGFRALVVDGALPPVEVPYSEGCGGAGDVFLLRGKRDVSVLERKICEAEQAVRRSSVRLVLLDEVGGIELASEAFMSLLSRILAGGKPCIGVFKSPENLASTLQATGVSDRYQSQHQALKRIIQQEGELKTLTKENRQAVRAQASRFVEAALKA
ncbi:MAG: nucleoside-triphosphatase [Eggerthellaceae bacterium]|jgi:nucleoside-triphosphatase THEP1|nr:nucleoside-triphosphatase [Eggerthellaceae bacterium]MDR2716405.1 nucleoside-triphosphatase [Coriobacteriaceae bacterium]